MSRVGSLAVAACLSLASVGAAFAADPSPATSAPTPSRPAASQAPLPDLTMAPLVTLPPISPSLIADAGVPTDGYAMGDPGAPVTIDVYADFQCPYCQRFSLLVAPELIDSWVRPGQARLVFHDFAFLGEESRWAAVAARLAAQQNRFWPFHDLLYSNLLGENVGSYTPDRLLVMGQMAGLDMDAFLAGLQVPAARATWALIDQEVRAAASTLGVSATPTVFVNGVQMTSPDAATIGAAVQAALALGSPVASTGPSASAGPRLSPAPAGSSQP
ncbi:MAG: DsbA family protein [Chloroflexota bacterium]